MHRRSREPHRGGRSVPPGPKPCAEPAPILGPPRSVEWLLGGGDLGQLIRSTDWSETPLGPRAAWSESLAAVVNLVVNARLPMALAWGPDRVLLYNDACRGIAAEQHPAALGRALREVWPERWPAYEPILTEIFAGGASVELPDEPFRIRRGDQVEVARYALGFSPVYAGDGTVAGALLVFEERGGRLEQARLLRESEARYRMVTEHSLDGINIFDLSTMRYTYRSPAQVAMTGFTAEELAELGTDAASERVHPDDRHITLERQRRIASGEDPGGTPVEYRWKVKSGEYRWFSDSRSLVRDEEGRPVAVVGISRDITDRKRAEAAAQTSQEILRTVINHMPASVALIRGFDLRLQLVNPAYQAIAPGKEMVGKTLDDLWAETGRDFTRICRHVLETGEPHRVTDELNLIQRRPGDPLEPAWFSWSMHRVRLPGDEGWGLLNAAWETTQRVQTENALRESEENLKRANQDLWVERLKLETIIRELPTGVVISDAEGNPVSMNAVALQLHGFDSAEEMAVELPRYHDQVELCELEGAPLPDEDWPAVRARNGDFVTNRELRFRNRQQGSERIVAISVVPLRDVDGRVVLLVWLIQDITEHKKTEARLQAANRRLVEADQRKDEFLAVLSHELRNPLAPITNGLYILERAAPGSDEARNAQRIIDRQVRQMTRLVDDLLDMTRVTRGKIRLQHARLEFNELVRRTIEDHRSLFVAHDLALQFEPARGPVFIDGDTSRLGQALGNLLQNAVKFTGAGGRVSVSLAVDWPARLAVLRVTDTGNGMDPAVLERVFEPFRQGDMSLARSTGGLGLGLTLVKGIAELHGGEVSAHSAGIGQGAEFVLSLPLDPREPEPPEAQQSPAGVPHRRVLLVEDNADAADSLRTLLRMAGHEVEVAADGRAGIAKAREFRPEVLLCDIGLPGMDGYEVARRLRADAAFGDLFLVALSGYALPDDLQRAAAAGFDQHLAKPPDLARLERLLADLPRAARP